MKNISGESFEIRLEEDNSTVFFKGALRLSGTEDYAPILEMLKGTLINPPAPIVVDLRELDFLNSSGLAMLSRFVIEARNQSGINLHVFASGSIPWHARSLQNLQRLMPALMVHLT